MTEITDPAGSRYVNPILSVLLPVLNEGDVIKKNIKETIETLEAMDHTYEIIVIDDGSTDGTREIVKEMIPDYPTLRLVVNDINMGKGMALRNGWTVSRGSFVAFVDGDLEIHPKQLSSFMDVMQRMDADVVIGSKRHPGSIIEYPQKKKILSKGFNLLVNSLFDIGVSDTQLGFKLFRKCSLDDAFPRMVVKRWAYDLELLILCDQFGYKIVEAPIELKYSKENGGRIGISDVVNIFKDMMGVFYRKNIISYYSEPEKILVDIIEDEGDAYEMVLVEGSHASVKVTRDP